jgi:hypothetical protein
MFLLLVAHVGAGLALTRQFVECEHNAFVGKLYGVFPAIGILPREDTADRPRSLAEASRCFGSL